MLSDAVVMTIIASSSAVLALIAKLTYSSRCTVVRCCCCSIQRDTDKEHNIIYSSNRTIELQETKPEGLDSKL